MTLKNTQADIEKAVAAILAQENGQDSGRPVIIIGHSWGGAAALETAQLLDDSSYPSTVDPEVLKQVTANVDLLFLIDAELGGRWMKRSLRDNVNTTVNLHAQTIFPDRWWNVQNGVDYLEGAQNIAAPKWSNFGTGGWFGWHRVGHNNITTIRDYQGNVVPNPETFNLVADYATQTISAHHH